MSASGEQEIELLVFNDDKKAKQHAIQSTRTSDNVPATDNYEPIPSSDNYEPIPSSESSFDKHKEIAEPLSLAGVQELKGVLSEALNTTLFKFTVVIVFVFNFSYSLFNSFRQDGQDESNDDIANKCHCNGRHKTFYVTLILASSVMWFIILVLEKFYTWFVCPGRYDYSLLELIRDNSKFESYFTNELNMLLSAVYDNQSNMIKLITKLKKEQCNSDDSEAMLIFEIPHYLKNSFPDSMPTTLGEAYCKKSIFKSAKDNVSRQYRHFRSLKRRHKAVSSFKLFLIINQFLSQLLIIPLLQLQWLDQYAWVCVAGITRNYCDSNKDVYNLALDQAVVVYMFYASILYAALLSMVIGWLPQYKED